MPSLTLKLSSTLRKYIIDYDPYTGMEVEFELPATVGDIVNQLGIPTGEIHIIMVDSAHASLETPVTDKSRLALFPAVGGG